MEEKTIRKGRRWGGLEEKSRKDEQEMKDEDEEGKTIKCKEYQQRKTNFTLHKFCDET